MHGFNPLVLLPVVSACSMILGGLITHKRGRGAALGAALGLVLGLIGVMIAFGIHRTTSGCSRYEPGADRPTATPKPVPTTTIACAITAIAWMSGIVAVAYFAPLFSNVTASGTFGQPETVTRTSSTFISENGPGSEWFVIAPLIATLVASFGIYLLWRDVQTLGAALTYPTICALGLFAFVGLLSIGIAILPLACLLTVATTSLPARVTSEASPDPWCDARPCDD